MGDTSDFSKAKGYGLSARKYGAKKAMNKLGFPIFSDVAININKNLLRRIVK